MVREEERVRVLQLHAMQTDRAGMWVPVPIRVLLLVLHRASDVVLFHVLLLIGTDWASDRRRYITSS